MMVVHLSASQIQRGNRRSDGDYADDLFKNTFLVSRREAESLDRYRYCKSHLDTDWSVVMLRTNMNVEMDAEYLLDQPAYRLLRQRLEVAPINNFDFLTRWTRLEALAKLTDTPVIVLLKSQWSVSRSLTTNDKVNEAGAELKGSDTTDLNATYSFATAQLSLRCDDRYASIICSVCAL